MVNKADPAFPSPHRPADSAASPQPRVNPHDLRFLNDVIAHTTLPFAAGEIDGRRPIHFNRAFEELVGYSAQELERMDFRQLTPERWHEQDEKRFAQLLAGGKAVRSEKEYRRKDGTIVPVSFLSDLHYDEHGRPACFYAFVTDLSEQKRQAAQLEQVQKDLRESEERLRVTFESAAIGIAIVSPQGRVLKVNRALCRMFGYPEQVLLADNRPRTTHPQDVRIERPLLGKLLAGEVPNYQFECRVVCRDGHTIFTRRNVSLVRDTEGAPQYLVHEVEDITERRLAEARLEQAHRQLSEASRQAGMAEVATNVLHNVGNVLNSVNISARLVAASVAKSRISGLAKVVALLREHAADLASFIGEDPKGRQVPAYLAQLSGHLETEQARILAELKLLQENVEHIKKIVAMQQDYAKGADIAESVDLAELVRAAARVTAEPDDTAISIACESTGVAPLVVDKHKVLQVLVNLLSNARQACADSGSRDGRIVVQTVQDNGWVRISVIDNGVGIPAANLTRIFNHGFTTRKTGHGFGLHSAAIAAGELGGSLRAHSAGEGRGATFVLELPLAAKASP
jgi:PAS domain S-box-containing protein